MSSTASASRKKTKNVPWTRQCRQPPDRGSPRSPGFQHEELEPQQIGRLPAFFILALPQPVIGYSTRMGCTPSSVANGSVPACVVKNPVSKGAASFLPLCQPVIKPATLEVSFFTKSKRGRFRRTNSGSRRLLFSLNAECFVPLQQPEF